MPAPFSRCPIISSRLPGWVLIFPNKPYIDFPFHWQNNRSSIARAACLEKNLTPHRLTPHEMRYLSHASQGKFGYRRDIAVLMGGAFHVFTLGYRKRSLR